MIRILNLALDYGATRILDVSNLAIDTSRITALSGANGSGKSTLLRVIGFLQKPTSGSVELWGRKRPNLEVLRQISVLFPEPVLLKRSVQENFKFALKSRGLESEFSSRVGEALELTGLDESFLDKRHFELSSGQTQRVAFALNLALRSRLYLLDEPTNSVDLATSKLFGRAVKYMQERYKSGFVIASHDEKWLSAIAQDSVFLHGGRVSEFELRNIFTVAGGALEFSENSRINLPYNLSSARKIAVNPNLIEIQFNHFEGALVGILHSVSLALEDKILVKIKVGDLLIKSLQNRQADVKFTTGERVYFCLPPNSFLRLE